MWKLKHQRNNKGFTLTELLITIGIIGILSSLGVVTIGKVKGTNNQTTCVNNLRAISQGLQLYYNDYMSFPEDGYPDDPDDLYPLSVDIEEYITNKNIFVCPEDNDPISSSSFASYDPYYVARKGSYDSNELAVGCPRHRGGNNSTSTFSTGSTEITKVGTVLANGQEMPPDGTTAQRTINSVNDVMTFDDGSTVTVTDASGGSYGCILVQSVQLADGTLYSIVKVQDSGTIDVQVTSGSKFEVVTPSAIVGVRGTEFTVTTSNDGSATDVTITSGVVVVTDRASGEINTLEPDYNGDPTTSSVAKDEHSHPHWHADGTYHKHPHQKKNNAHHGYKRRGKKAANEPLLDSLADTSVTSSDIKTALNAASPLSKSVLRSAINRKPAMISSDLKDVLVNESPLERRVLRSIIRKYSSMNSSDNKDVLIANSPLSKRILRRVKKGHPPMNSGDLQSVLNAQGGDNGGSNDGSSHDDGSSD